MAFGVSTWLSPCSFFGASQLRSCALRSMMAARDNGKARKLFIDSEYWCSARAGEMIEVIDPSTERAIGTIAAGKAADVDDAVAAARAAFYDGPWPRMDGSRRAEVLSNIAALVRENKDDLAKTETLDCGKPLDESAWDIDDVAGAFDYYAGIARRSAAEERVELGEDGFGGVIRREPLGPIAAITPWNYPMLMATWKVRACMRACATTIPFPPLPSHAYR